MSNSIQIDSGPAYPGAHAINATPLPAPDPGILEELLTMAHDAIGELIQKNWSAAVSHLRGDGPGVSFRSMIEQLEADHPVDLVYPFEQNPRVGGAVWPQGLLREHHSNAVLKLRWEPGANDLPMHTHTLSDRFIVVYDGRGYFHVSDESVDGFSGAGVRTIAARERDVFIFRRGVVHTFSTDQYPMTLLSCHLPYIDLDDPRQYTLATPRWTAVDKLGEIESRVTLIDGWTRLAGVS